MRSDSLSPSWYEPPALLDVEHEDVADPEALSIAAGVVSWTCTHDDD